MTPFFTKQISFVINRKLRILFFLTSLGKLCMFSCFSNITVLVLSMWQIF